MTHTRAELEAMAALQQIRVALESIAKSLEKMANPAITTPLTKGEPYEDHS